jgi:histidine-containing phosphotransfer protein
MTNHTLKSRITMLQGYLDEQFIQLEELQDDDSPKFVEETVTMFFNDSTRLLQNIEQAL